MSPSDRLGGRMALRFAQVVRTASVVTGRVRGERSRSPRAPQASGVLRALWGAGASWDACDRVGSPRSACDRLASRSGSIQLEQVVTETKDAPLTREPR